jgi:cadmium resistance protein CadD (predicted permease)
MEIERRSDEMMADNDGIVTPWFVMLKMATIATICAVYLSLISVAKAVNRFKRVRVSKLIRASVPQLQQIR